MRTTSRARDGGYSCPRQQESRRLRHRLGLAVNEIIERDHVYATPIIRPKRGVSGRETDPSDRISEGHSQERKSIVEGGNEECTERDIRSVEELQARGVREINVREHGTESKHRCWYVRAW